MSKKLSEMTIDELRALPVYEMFGREACTIREDGTIQRSNGDIHKVSGRPGDTIMVPTVNRTYCALYGPNDPIFWWDEKGEDAWCAVKTPDGLARRRFW
jgi:hypothetical protein